MRELSPMAITFNGHVFDEEIKGFTTLNVEGRGLFAPNLSTITVPGRDGDVVTEKQYPARDIVVHFLLEEEKHGYFLESLRKLNALLQSKEAVAFSFADEDGFRLGEVSAVENPPFDRHVGVGKITIHCSDPFLYGRLQETDGEIPILDYPEYPVKIESISVQVRSDDQQLTIRNVRSGKKIILQGLSGGVLVIQKDRITQAGENFMAALDFVNSDYHSFECCSGDVILSEPRDVRVMIRFRERAL